MKLFFKLIVWSVLYALPFFLVAELQLNIYRIERVMGLSVNIINALSFIIFIVTISIVVYMSKKILNATIFYTIAILWIIPFFLLIRMFPMLFPFNRQEIPPPITGIVIIFEMIIFSLALLITMIYIVNKNKERKTLL